MLLRRFLLLFCYLFATSHVSDASFFHIHIHFDTWCLATFRSFFTAECQTEWIWLFRLIHIHSLFFDIITLWTLYGLLAFAHTHTHCYFNHTMTSCLLKNRFGVLVSFSTLFILVECILFEFRTRMKCVKYKKKIHQRHRSKRYKQQAMFTWGFLHPPLARLPSSFVSMQFFPFIFLLLLLLALFLFIALAFVCFECRFFLLHLDRSLFTTFANWTLRSI